MKDHWVFGGVVSVIIHAVLLVAIFSFGGGGATTAEEPDVSTATAVERVDPVRPVEPVAPTGAGDVADAEIVASYTVRSGDNLSRIARNHGTTVAALADLNGMSVSKLANLRIGQVIKVPAKDE